MESLPTSLVIIVCKTTLSLLSKPRFLDKKDLIETEQLRWVQRTALLAGDAEDEEDNNTMEMVSV
jgi:hypothetical protein